jgi:hypothetical protein
MSENSGHSGKRLRGSRNNTSPRRLLPMRPKRSRNLNLKSILSRPITTKGSERSRRRLNIPQNQLLLISLPSLLRLQSNSNLL